MSGQSDQAALGNGLPSVIVNKRKRIPSAADLVIRGNKEPIETLETFIKNWKKLDGGDSDITEAADDRLKSLKYLEKYCEDNPEENVEAIPLSSLDLEDLVRMNAHVVKVVSFERWESGTIAQFNSNSARVISPKDIDDCWHQNEGALSCGLDGITQGVSNKPEPFARMLIDIILLLVLRRLNENVAGVLFVELPISKGTDYPTCIKCVVSDTETETTFLMGRVDYLLLVCQERVEEAKLAVLKAPDQAKASLKSFVRDKGIRKIWIFNDESVQGFVFEAKVEERKKLIDHLPQVIGECLVTMAVASRNAVPWCLTTGKTWIFGNVVGKQSVSGWKYSVYHSEPISWNIEGQPQDVVKKKRNEVMKRVFMMLAYWAIMKPHDIEVFSENL